MQDVYLPIYLGDFAAASVLTTGRSGFSRP